MSDVQIVINGQSLTAAQCELIALAIEALALSLELDFEDMPDAQDWFRKHHCVAEIQRLFNPTDSSSPRTDGNSAASQGENRERPDLEDSHIDRRLRE